MVCQQWTVLDHPCRAYAVLNWLDLGKVQIVYIKSNNDYELELEFMTIAKNTFPLPQVLSIWSGLGKEVLFHISGDINKDTDYIRVCDYPDTMVYPENGRLCWLGDIPLYTIYTQREKFTFTNIQPVEFRFDSHDEHCSSYLIEYKQLQQQQQSLPPYYEIARVVYAPPMHWRHNRGAKTADRSLPENFYAQIMSWPAERYMDINDYEHGWDSVAVKTLDALDCQLMPASIALVNAQNILDTNGKKTDKKRFKITVKNIPLNHDVKTCEQWPNWRRCRSSSKVLSDPKVKGMYQQKSSLFEHVLF